jgi:hypothetical protein
MAKLALHALHAAILAGALAAPAAQARDGNHALIIGISHYSAESGADPLLGVPHDVENARRMAAAMGVDPAAIVELRDAQATKEHIVQQLEVLRAAVQGGDKVLLYFSGHGTRLETADGCKEGFSTYTGAMLTDEELATYTQPISRLADKLLVMIDACFSGGVIQSATRSLLEAGNMRAKFSAGASAACMAPVNQSPTRSLLSELKRLGVHEENFVQIAAANFNEVSWDNKAFGGLATSSVARCLLGEAKDLDESGAISLDEVRACAQSRMNDLMQPYVARGMSPSTLQVKGNRNLVVVATPPAAEIVPPSLPSVPPPEPTPPLLPPPPAPPLAAVPAPPLEAQRPATGARATLEEIFQQRDPRLKVDVVAPARLKIGREPLHFTVRSSANGYLYAVLLGSDASSFYLLFPNKLDADNRISANRDYVFPRPGWKVAAGGPAGTDRMLFVVSPTPRDPQVFAAASSGGGPYTYSVANLKSRQRLIDFFIGKGVRGRNAALGAALVDVEEIE